MALCAIMLLFAACCFFPACAAVYRAAGGEYDVGAITASQKSNGWVIKIEATTNISDVTAWLGNDNWLYITIPDTSVNVRQLNQLEQSPIVAKEEFFRYEEAVQVTLQLQEKMDQVVILRYPDNDNIYVVLYQSKSNL